MVRGAWLVFGGWCVVDGRMVNRRPNQTIVCMACGASRTLYVHPSRPVRFCSKVCANRWTAENRRVVILAGAAHPNWKGDNAKARSGRSRALRAFPVSQACVDCGAHGERHHKDENTLNNHKSNIEWVCRACHSQRHIATLRRVGSINIKKAQAKRWQK